MELTLAQIYLLMSEASKIDRFYALQLSFIVFTGCTVEESCELIWEDVHVEEHEVRLEKKNIPLNLAALRILSGCSKEDDPYVFRFRHPSQVHNRTRILTRKISGRLTEVTLRQCYAALAWMGYDETSLLHSG